MASEGEATSSSSWGDVQMVQWLDDIHLMKSYATAEGMTIPPTLAEDLASLAKDNKDGLGASGLNNLDRMIPKALAIHSALARLVAPATPRSLRVTNGNGGGSSWWQNKMIRWVLILASIAVVVFAVSAAVPVAGENVRNQVSWTAAALLGAAFYNLFTAYKYIVARTFDPQYEIVYVMRFVLGVISGVILANFGKGLGGGNFAINGVQLGGALFGLIGGYSSEAVNQILMRVSETLVTAVKGSGDAQVRAKDQEVKATKAQAAADRDSDRDQLNSELDTLLNSIGSGSNTDDLKKRIDDLKRRIGRKK